MPRMKAAILLGALLILLDGCTESQPGDDEARAQFRDECPGCELLEISPAEDEGVAHVFRVWFREEDGAQEEARLLYSPEERSWSLQRTAHEFILSRVEVSSEVTRGRTPEVGAQLTPPRITSRGSIDFNAIPCEEPWTAALVLAKVTISAAGTLDDVEILKGPTTACQRRLLSDQVASWRFEPAMQDGAPVAATTHISIHVYFR